MCRSWIKLCDTTPDKPEIYKMATILKIHEGIVFWKCCKLWLWADANSTDGRLGIGPDELDRMFACPGLFEALRTVGWATTLGNRYGVSICLSNFTRHMDSSDKYREQNRLRQKRFREKVTLRSVTPSSSSSTSSLLLIP
jgi:hypothetical protein